MLDNTLSRTDIFDFDYYSSNVAVTGDNEEERQLYLTLIEPQLTGGEKKNPGKIIPLWLNAKRNNNAQLSPGRVVNSGFRLIFSIFALTGLLTGIGAAVSYLSYSGARPINITIYLFVFVFSQIFFQVLSIVTLVSSGLNLFSDFFKTPHSLLLLLIKKTTRFGEGKIPADKRIGFAAAVGKLKVSKNKYGDIYFWMMFRLFQFTGLMFSTGVLIATLFKVITSDLAFGWQTTIQAAPDKIFDMIRGFSIPWSWIISPDKAYPDLSNIKGSQILLKDGIVNLVSSDMASWWPFLCFAVLFYTIIPRIVLFLTGLLFEKRALKKTFRNNTSVERLVRLLTSPQMTVEKSDMARPSSKTKNTFDEAQSNSRFISGDTFIALIPEDIYSADFIQGFETKIEGRSGTVSESIKITGDISEDADILEKLPEKITPGATAGILIVYESWLPPIKETTEYIKSIREHTGKSMPITVWLTGKPDAGKNGYNKVKDSDFKTWNLKLLAMGDADISLARDDT